MEEETEGKERGGDIMWSVALCAAASTYRYAMVVR